MCAGKNFAGVNGGLSIGSQMSYASFVIIWHFMSYDAYDIKIWHKFLALHDLTYCLTWSYFLPYMILLPAVHNPTSCLTWSYFLPYMILLPASHSPVSCVCITTIIPCVVFVLHYEPQPLLPHLLLLSLPWEIFVCTDRLIRHKSKNSTTDHYLRNINIFLIIKFFA